MSKYNRIISKLLENTRSAPWHKDEVQDLLDRAESVREKTLKLCNRHDIDEEEPALWHGLTALIGYLEKMVDAANGRGICGELVLCINRRVTTNLASQRAGLFAFCRS